MAERSVAGRSLLVGEAAGPALVLAEPLSFWGGVDAATGTIVDPHHPQRGASVGGRVLVLASGRGSSSSSSVLVECLLAGVGPAAIVLGEPDAILLVGAVVAVELGGPTCPDVVAPEALNWITTADLVTVRPDGTITAERRR
jgi:predicted aconitase with swiveling domain